MYQIKQSSQTKTLGKSFCLWLLIQIVRFKGKTKLSNVKTHLLFTIEHLFVSHLLLLIFVLAGRIWCYGCCRRHKDYHVGDSLFKRNDSGCARNNLTRDILSVVYLSENLSFSPLYFYLEYRELTKTEPHFSVKCSFKSLETG